MKRILSIGGSAILCFALSNFMLLIAAIGAPSEKVITTTEGVTITNGQSTLQFAPLDVGEAATVSGRRPFTFHYKWIDGSGNLGPSDPTWIDNNGTELSLPSERYRTSASEGWFRGYASPSRFDGITVRLKSFPLIRVQLTAEPKAAKPVDSELQAAQKKLESLGFDPGPADGLMGQRTAKALRDFQATEGLSVSGKLDAQTKDTLQRSTAHQ